MLRLAQQLHGYRQGHQLLSASCKLPNADQDLIDRLSDVGGPLRPGERFTPYLTCYPLPSGSYYVFARTWQDFEAPRSGCVRTRSIIVPMRDWMSGVNVVGLAEALSKGGPSGPTDTIEIEWPEKPLPHIDPSQGVELVEALFLEDRKPIVVFDAVDPEAITLRLLTAFWPALRRSFAVSTFALSPRTIGGRSFDLVFAPKDAKSRFSDWLGRRIDSHKPAVSRHRWSNEIVDRVLSSDPPSLLRGDVLGELSSGADATEAEFRISLLWNELYNKLESSPNAALGLLDIANSRTKRNLNAIKRLEPALVRTAQRIVVSFSPSEAWRFLVALVDKLKGLQLDRSTADSIRDAAGQLTARAPADAINTVPMLVGNFGELLRGAIGDTVAQDFNAELANYMLDIAPVDLMLLLLNSQTLAKISLAQSPSLSSRLAIALEESPASNRVAAKKQLLPLLVEDVHIEAAEILIQDLDQKELVDEVKLLASANGLISESLHGPIVERAQQLDFSAEIRDTVADLSPCKGVDALLLRLLAPTQSDIRWLLETPVVMEDRRTHLLRELLLTASNAQLRAITSGPAGSLVLGLLMREPTENLALLERILVDGQFEASMAITAIMQVLPFTSPDWSNALAWRGLELLLPRDIGDDRQAILDGLFRAVDSRFHGARAIQLALAQLVSSEVASANLAAFNRAEPDIRQRIMRAIDDLARMIVGRGWIDVAEWAVTEASILLWDSRLVDPQAYLRASSTLLPFLLRSRYEPASPLIAAAFPSVYRELAKQDDASDFFKFFIFTDWDKCKTARHELVDAFMRSNWQATDIALAAARSGDTSRILQHISKQDGGWKRIDEIRRNIDVIPYPWRDQIKNALEDDDGSR